MKLLFKAFLCCLLFSIPFYALAQKEWDDVDISKLQWSVSEEAYVYSNTLQNLNFWNYNAEAKENKKNNTWTYKSASMGISWEVDVPWQITFTISNLHNDHNSKYKVLEMDSKQEIKESWYNGNVYWGFIVSVNNKSGGDESFKKYYSDRKTLNSSYTFLDTYSSYTNKWYNVTTTTPSLRTVRIAYDGKDKITVSGGVYKTDEQWYTFYNAKSIKSIEICAGVAANVKVQDFKIQVASRFAHVVPHVKSGDEKYKKEDYFGAAEDYSKVISAGYEDYDIYYKRASAYYCVEFFNNAIDDYTNALRFKESEEAYLYRGLSKLQKGDATCLDDLKKGGQRGVALAKEIEGGNVTGGTSSTVRSEYVSQGTGVIIDSKGYVATNAHVIEGAREIDVLVTVAGVTRKFSAECILQDKSNDLALLKIVDNSYTKLPDVPFGFLHTIKDVGSSVFAMGYPKSSQLGEEIKVTDGIISSRTGYQGDVTTYQISAPIQPGSSGGPLFDSNGNLVGITSSGVQSLENVGYAIKTSYLKNLTDLLPGNISLPAGSQLTGYSFTEKIKRLSPYVVMIKVK